MYVQQLKRRTVTSNILTVYYSRKGFNYWNGSIVDLKKGNTQIAAEMVQKAVGGDLFEIRTVKEYASDYRACCEEARQEMREKARPQLKDLPTSLDGYDILFVGYPCWCGTMPMAVFSFLEKYDLTGKKIAPFCFNEGSGMGFSERDLKEICKGAEVVQGLSVRGSRTAESEQEIAAWARSVL